MRYENTEEDPSLKGGDTKTLRKELKALGVGEQELPEILQDPIVEKGKKGPLGALVVRRVTGFEQNAALKTVREFEKNVGGREDIAEKLSAVKDELSGDQKNLLAVLLHPTKKSLARLLLESGVEPTSLMKQYARGCVELGRVQAAIEAHRNLPHLVKDLYRHALEGVKSICAVCIGSGKVRARKGAHKDLKDCPQCLGEGTTLAPSELKKFAMDKILQITKLTEAPGSSNVNVTQQTLVKTTGGGASPTMEKMMLTSDAILYPPPKKEEDVVEAEVVDPVQ